MFISPKGQFYLVSRINSWACDIRSFVHPGVLDTVSLGAHIACELNPTVNTIVLDTDN